MGTLIFLGSHGTNANTHPHE